MSTSTVSRTFAFVDLAGYSAATDAHGDEYAAGVNAAFVRNARDSLGPGDELVKSIGDAVMLASEDSAAALRLVCRVHTCLDDRRVQHVRRSGIHRGPAVHRDGDYFGAAVNVAARIAALARGQQVLATDDVASVARSLGFRVVSLGRHSLHGLQGPLELFDVLLCPPALEAVTDPVCQMSLDPLAAAGQMAFGEKTYWFCSVECAALFVADPERFV